MSLSLNLFINSENKTWQNISKRYIFNSNWCFFYSAHAVQVVLVPLRPTPFNCQLLTSHFYDQLLERNRMLITSLHDIKVFIVVSCIVNRMYMFFIASISNPYFIKQWCIRLAVVFFFRFAVLSINLIPAT